jgi:hypothetical protein
MRYGRGIGTVSGAKLWSKFEMFEVWVCKPRLSTDNKYSGSRRTGVGVARGLGNLTQRHVSCTLKPRGNSGALSTLILIALQANSRRKATKIYWENELRTPA